MTIAYDTLAFSKALQKAGIDPAHADAQAEAIRDHVMPELATRADVVEIKHLIETESWRTRFWLGATVVATGIAAVSIVAALIKFT